MRGAGPAGVQRVGAVIIVGVFAQLLDGSPDKE